MKVNVFDILPVVILALATLTTSTILSPRVARVESDSNIDPTNGLWCNGGLSAEQCWMHYHTFCDFTGALIHPAPRGTSCTTKACRCGRHSTDIVDTGEAASESSNAIPPRAELSTGSTESADLWRFACTKGASSQTCFEQFGTHCNTTGHILNVASSGDSCTATNCRCAYSVNVKEIGPSNVPVDGKDIASLTSSKQSRTELSSDFNESADFWRLVCFKGASTQTCMREFNTYCDTSGHVDNPAPSGEDCTVSDCYCMHSRNVNEIDAGSLDKKDIKQTRTELSTDTDSIEWRLVCTKGANPQVCFQEFRTHCSSSGQFVDPAPSGDSCTLDDCFRAPPRTQNVNDVRSGSLERKDVDVSLASIKQLRTDESSVDSTASTTFFWHLECLKGISSQLCFKKYGTSCNPIGKIIHPALTGHSCTAEDCGCVASSGNTESKHTISLTSSKQSRTEDSSKSVFFFFHLACSIGTSPQLCYTEYGTSCNTTGDIIHPASTGDSCTADDRVCVISQSATREADSRDDSEAPEKNSYNKPESMNGKTVEGIMPITTMDIESNPISVIPFSTTHSINFESNPVGVRPVTFPTPGYNTKTASFAYSVNIARNPGGPKIKAASLSNASMQTGMTMPDGSIMGQSTVVTISSFFPPGPPHPPRLNSTVITAGTATLTQTVTTILTTDAVLISSTPISSATKTSSVSSKAATFRTCHNIWWGALSSIIFGLVVLLL